MFADLFIIFYFFFCSDTPAERVTDIIVSYWISKDLSRAQRAFSKTLQNFSFECIGETQTEDESHISQSLKEFGKLIASIEDERDRMVSTSSIRKLRTKQTKNEKNCFFAKYLWHSDKRDFLLFSFYRTYWTIFGINGPITEHCAHCTALKIKLYISL